MAIITVTVYANNASEAENRNDTNNEQSSFRVSATHTHSFIFVHILLSILFSKDSYQMLQYID